MRPGPQKNDSDMSSRPSLDGSFTKGESASVRSTSSTSNKFIPTSKRALKELATTLVDLNTFIEYTDDWVRKNLYAKSSDGEKCFSSPFLVEDLHTFDFALEGILFQQLLRMPYPPYASEHRKEDEYLALEDFLYTATEGLWHAFWHKSKPLPYLVSCSQYPGSKFYTVEEAISRGRLKRLGCAALISRSSGSLKARWDDVALLVLFKQDVMIGNEFGASPSVVCEALFYAIHILLARSMSKTRTFDSDYVYVSLMDSKFGGVLKLGGDLTKLDVDITDPYQSVKDWITCHGEVSISSVNQVWNKLGNVNWGDLGTLQILLSIFDSMIQWNGPPRKSMTSLAANHDFRLQKRRMESQLSENRTAPAAKEHGSSYQGEIVELDCENSQKCIKKSYSRLKLGQGDALSLEDQNRELKTFQIQDIIDSNTGCSYIAVASDCPVELLSLYVGAHPSRLEPSWEGMNLWYQVQRQTKVLNMIKEQATPCKNLPEIVASGRIVHSGPCLKQDPKGCCDHPWCGTPILVARSVGTSLSSLIARDDAISAEVAMHCCRDCLSALKSAKMAHIMHGDICPENIMCTMDGQNWSENSSFVLVSWGRAVLEDRDSPALNLQFSSSHALEHGKLCPSSDVESLVYLIYFLTGGAMHQLDSIESALKWRQRCWAKRAIQRHLGEVSSVLKAFADYVDSICGTPYEVDYDVWLEKMNVALDGSSKRGKAFENGSRLMDVAESSGTSGGGISS